MFTTNSLCLIVCSIHEWRLFRGLPTAFFSKYLSMSGVYFEVFPRPFSPNIYPRVASISRSSHGLFLQISIHEWRLFRGLPTAFFPKYCSFKTVYYKLVMPNCMPYPSMASFFLMFKSNLSCFALWKTSSFFTTPFSFYYVCYIHTCIHTYIHTY